MRFVDLSAPLDNDASWAPWWSRTRVKRQSHRFGRFVMWLLFGVKGKHLATGLGWTNDVLKLSSHGATHVDAPWHYAPTCGGTRSRTIDEMPLDWFFAPGVVIDLRHLDRDEAATVDHLNDGLGAAGHDLAAGDIVLIQTGNDSLFGDRAYFSAGPGVSAEATRWLIDQGVRVMGIDAWGWDQPLEVQARLAKKTGRSDIFWAAHFVGIEKEYCQIERLAHLDQLPSTGFRVCAFPLKVVGGSAGPARVVAILED